MSRDRGTFTFAANFEPLLRAPIDARQRVNTKADLTSPTTWDDGTGQYWLYAGMLVSVVSDSTPSNNGLYYLTNHMFFTDPNMWVKIGVGSIDASGTSSMTFQLNNGLAGVILKDASGNLEIRNGTNTAYASIKVNNVDASTLKISDLNGLLYANAGVVTSVPGAYKQTIQGNDVSTVFNINHNLNTLRHSITVYDTSAGTEFYPSKVRGTTVDLITFSQPPPNGEQYDVVVVGF